MSSRSSVQDHSEIKRWSHSTRVWVLVMVLGACGGPSQRTMPREPGRVDAPYELENDDDLAETRQAFTLLNPGSKSRDQARIRLADEYARRIRSNLKRGERDGAFLAFQNLAGLWTAKELRNGPTGLEQYAEEIQNLRALFSRSGGAMEAIATLDALSLIRPGQSKSYQAEIDEIIVYSNELGISKNGAGANRARTISILESVSHILPSDTIVNRLVSLYQKRQQAIQSAFRRKGADYELLRVHGMGALNSTHNIVAFLVEAGRSNEALTAIESIEGLGDDSNLRASLKRLRAHKTAAPFIGLAALFTETARDKEVALRLCQKAIEEYPDNAAAAIAAGDAAKAVDNARLAIRYYERGLKLAPTNLSASQTLASLYEQQVASLAFAGRPNAAQSELRRFERFHKQASAQLDKPLSPDLSSAYSAMARGLVSLGELQSAKAYLSRSLKLRPNLSTLEYLGTLSLRQGNANLAAGYYQRAISIDAKSFSEKFSQLKLGRLLAESRSLVGQGKLAAKIRSGALLQWARLLKEYELGKETSGAALIEIGKLEFDRGNRELASTFFFQALSAGAFGKGDHADLVSFLITRNSYQYALDVYLDALGNREVSNYFKTYMSLWILAESYREGKPAESHAMKFLKEQKGGLWSAHLARFAATGKGRTELAAMASTRGRRAEFLYYSAVVGPERKEPERVRELLDEVIRSSMVLFFEYEMAKVRLDPNSRTR